MTAPLLSIRNLDKRFGSAHVLKNLSLDLAANELVTVLGESGSGKTTLLRIIAGFEQADGGEVSMDGTRIDQLPANRRPVNTVFQQYALFPHLTVFENISYGLRAKRTPEAEIQIRVPDALQRIQMATYRDRRPRQLSGGQQQRVALARALVNDPLLLLLDEPFSALDATLRLQMQAELKALQRSTGVTFLFITHDQDEAMAIADRIAVMRNGVLEQVATPRELYERPKTRYVAGFFGRTNFVPSERGVLSIRPEEIRVAAGAAPDDCIRYSGVVRTTTFAGPSEWLDVVCPDGLELSVRVPNGTAVTGAVELDLPRAKLVPVA